MVSLETVQSSNTTQAKEVVFCIYLFRIYVNLGFLVLVYCLFEVGSLYVAMTDLKLTM